MQDVLSELLKETNYLDPYLRQFLKHLKKDELLLVGKKTDFLKDKIKKMGYDVENIEVLNNKTNEKYDGIILFNTLNEIDKSNIPKFFEDLSNILNENGFIFIVIRNNKDSNNYTKEYLDITMEENFEFIEELNNYDNLKFYIYEKKHY